MNDAAGKKRKNSSSLSQPHLCDIAQAGPGQFQFQAVPFGELRDVWGDGALSEGAPCFLPPFPDDFNWTCGRPGHLKSTPACCLGGSELGSGVHWAASGTSEAQASGESVGQHRPGSESQESLTGT